MTENTETYCRLCAEPRPIVQMLSPVKDVVANSKVITKLSWINIDISAQNTLPTTICFNCLDLLERTWSFLNNVRTAQEKLLALLSNKTKEIASDTAVETKVSDHIIPGKPVDEDWEIFQELKREIKVENVHERKPQTHPNDKVMISEDNHLDIKAEVDSDGDGGLIIDSNDDFNHQSTSDSDVPLKKTIRKKRDRPKLKDNSNKAKIIPKTDIQPSFVSWDNQACICAKCDAHCKSILSLQLHSLQIHDRCCIFKCIHCAKVSPGYRAFIRHTRTHDEALRHCCEYCNKILLYPSQLTTHKLKYHKKVYQTKCANCGANFESPDELNEHKALFYKTSKLNKIKNGKTLMSHKCEQCNKVFKSRANLHQHQQLHTERTKDYACHVCGKMFYTKGTLGTHLVVHEDNRPYKCNHCSLAFRAKGNLTSHLSLHSGLKPFICEQCGKSFRVKRHLMSHSIVHTDLRPYVCDYCHKSFRFKTRLNLHLRQHTGVRPYKCVYCQRDFTNGSNYKKHMKRRHAIDTSTRVTSKSINSKKEWDNSSETNENT